ncbi:NAD(P)-dependent oxidoreductase [Cytobacillus sp. FSL K6-0129]|uniref:NAD(P)-dependent oxidoreductase n=1 Tax=Cytobacillus sp. FSL K6-0129 TaxID=2921421 RepID=UPI0030FBE2FE
MKIAIIGASGKAGQFILDEAVAREHEVTAIVRNAGRINNSQVEVIEKNIFDIQAKDVKKYDIIVNAFKSPQGQEEQHVEAGKVLIDALKGQQSRLIVVGGAGSLYVDEETRLYETADFPKAYLPTATQMGKDLALLQNSQNVNWTYISPGAFFDAEGKRSGSYQKGKDKLFFNNQGDSYISYADFAIAVLDEAEQGKHVNERIAVVGDRA